MKKPSAKIREEISRLQDQLRQAETREAERIGRIALRAGLGDFEIEETRLQQALEQVAERFRDQRQGSIGKERGGGASQPAAAPVASDAIEGGGREA